MNEYCKDALMHSWGSSPERKKLEKQYNADYYAANKNRWVINRQKRLNRPLARQKYLTSGGGNINVKKPDTKVRDANDIIVAPFHLYDSPKDFIDASKQFWSTSIQLPATIVNTAKKAVEDVKEAGKKFINNIKKLKITDAIKKVGKGYKDALHSYFED